MRKQKYDPKELKQRVLLHLQAGITQKWSVMARTMDMPRSSLRDALNGEWPETQEAEDYQGPGLHEIEIIRLLKKGQPLSATQLANALDCGPATVCTLIAEMVETGKYDISQSETTRQYVLPKVPLRHSAIQEAIWPKGGTYRLGLCSDLHFGSTKHQGTALRHYAVTAADMGVEHMLVSGDITSGQRMFRGQDLETYAYGADEQIEAACEGIPEIEGMTWYLQGGNHDASHHKKGGINVVRRICTLRNDCTYVGFTQSDVPIVPGVYARMWHPSGGVPYAVSYRAQKGAEGLVKEWMGKMDSKENVAFMQWGHLHVRGLFWYGPIALIGPGCFEAQSLYLAEKALMPDISAVVVELTIAADGYITDLCIPSWKIYRPVLDDYRPRKRTKLLENIEVEPLFSMSRG